MDSLSNIQSTVLRALIADATKLANSERRIDAPVLTQDLKESIDAANEVFKEDFFKGSSIQYAANKLKREVTKLSFLWFVDPWRALLGKQRNNAKTSEPVSLSDAFSAWEGATKEQRKALTRVRGALARGGYKSLDDLKSATDEDLLKLKGLGPSGLTLIRGVSNSYED